MLLIFWFCFSLVVYVYLGYPLLLASGFLGRRKRIQRGGLLPSLSVIIPARNEEKMIRAKLENLLAQDYPRERFEILVGDDGSTDDTASIVAAFEPQGVHLISSHVNRGKSVTQNELVKRSKGSILVFTDADCLLPPDAFRKITRNFADPAVALVTNCASILNQDETGVVQSEGLYWRYERWLRLQESERGLLAMGSGSLFAVRRELWAPLDPNVGDDFVLPLRVARYGFRNVLETETSAQTRLSQNESKSMLGMKVRIVSKDLRGLLQNPACLNPLETGRIALGLWSHKLLRWAVPYFLIGLFVSNFFLLGDSVFYGIFLAAQVVFYLLPVVAAFLNDRRFRFPWSVVSSFCLVNLAALLGTLHCLSKRPAGQWKPVR